MKRAVGILCAGLLLLGTGCVWNFSAELLPGLAVNGFLLLLAIRFLFGAGEAGAFPVLSRVNAAWFPFRERAFAQGTVWSESAETISIGPRSGFFVSTFASDQGFRFAAAAWKSGSPGPGTE